MCNCNDDYRGYCSDLVNNAVSDEVYVDSVKRLASSYEERKVSNTSVKDLPESMKTDAWNVVMHDTRLLIKQVNSTKVEEIHREDIINIHLADAFKAALNCDFTKNNFYNYVPTVFSDSMKTFYIENNNGPTVKESYNAESNRQAKARKVLAEQLGHIPSDEEFAKYSGKTIKSVKEHRIQYESRQSGELLPEVAAPRKDLIDEIFYGAVNMDDFYDTLTPREFKIYSLAYGVNGEKKMPLTKLASHFGTTKNSINATLTLIERRMNDFLKPYGIVADFKRKKLV